MLVADGTRPAWRTGSFARVLADVPVPGWGRCDADRSPRGGANPGEVEQLHGLQLALLASALDSAAPGGVVGYVTCSPHRRETVDVVTETLAGRDDVEGGSGRRPAAAETPRRRHGDFVQLWPHRHGTDAMFAAYLRRALTLQCDLPAPESP